MLEAVRCTSKVLDDIGRKFHRFQLTIDMAEAVLQNERLRVTFLPEFGGKMSGLVDRSTGENLLLPAQAAYGGQGKDLCFADSDRGGFDECLPSVSACSPGPGMSPVPDHGELWHVPWRVLETSPHLCMIAEGAASGLVLRRCALLRGATLHLQYRLTNTASEPRLWLWSAHPLLAVDTGDRILLPKKVCEVSVEYTGAGEIIRRSVVSWPRPARGTGVGDLSEVAAADGKTAFKLFAVVGETGWCALHRKRLHRVLRFRFRPHVMPFVGVWISRGAWPPQHESKQVAVALEPCTAPYDSLVEATTNGYARRLGAGRSTSWELMVDVLPISDDADLRLDV